MAGVYARPETCPRGRSPGRRSEAAVHHVQANIASSVSERLRHRPDDLKPSERHNVTARVLVTTTALNCIAREPAGTRPGERLFGQRSSHALSRGAGIDHEARAGDVRSGAWAIRIHARRAEHGAGLVDRDHRSSRRRDEPQLTGCVLVHFQGGRRRSRQRRRSGAETADLSPISAAAFTDQHVAAVWHASGGPPGPMRLLDPPGTGRARDCSAPWIRGSLIGQRFPGATGSLSSRAVDCCSWAVALIIVGFAGLLLRSTASAAASTVVTVTVSEQAFPLLWWSFQPGPWCGGVMTGVARTCSAERSGLRTSFSLAKATSEGSSRRVITATTTGMILTMPPPLSWWPGRNVRRARLGAPAITTARS